MDNSPARCLYCIGSEQKQNREMPEKTLTLALSPDHYSTLQQRAQQHQRPLEEEARLALATALDPLPTVPDDLEAALNALASLDEDTLWQVSQSQPTVEDGILLDALVAKRRRVGLTPGEERWVAHLGERHDRVMVIRARAVALLHERGSMSRSVSPTREHNANREAIAGTGAGRCRWAVRLLLVK